jgi:hypothetical protein
MLQYMLQYQIYIITANNLVSMFRVLILKNCHLHFKEELYDLQQYLYHVSIKLDTDTKHTNPPQIISDSF